MNLQISNDILDGMRKKASPLPAPEETEAPPMTGEEFDATIRALGWTQIAFATWAGVTDRSVRRWCEDAPPQYIVRLVTLMRVIQPAADDAEKMTGDEFDDVIRGHGWTQTAFARWLGMTGRTVRVWAGEGPPLYIVRMVRMIARLYPKAEAGYGTQLYDRRRRTNVDTKAFKRKLARAVAKK